MKLAGFDIGGRRIALAVWDNETHELVRYQEAKVRKTLVRSQEIADLIDQLDLTGIDIAIVEESLIGPGVRASLMVTQTLGGLLYVLGKAQIETHVVPVASWKKAVIGHGHASKELVKSWVVGQHPDLGAVSQDVCDAIAISRYYTSVGMAG